MECELAKPDSFENDDTPFGLFTHNSGTPLSGEDIWINFLTQKRYTVHIIRFDIGNDLRPFLNFLVHPFSSKLRSKEAKGLKSGN